MIKSQQSQDFVLQNQKSLVTTAYKKTLGFPPSFSQGLKTKFHLHDDWIYYFQIKKCLTKITSTK